MNELNRIVVHDKDYDKERKYKNNKIRYMSKKRFKSLDCDEKSIRGFFRFKKAHTDNTVKYGNCEFDLLSMKHLHLIKGYTKCEDGGYYAVLSFPFIPIILIVFLLCGLLALYHLHPVVLSPVEPWIPIIDSGIVSDTVIPDNFTDHSIVINGFTEWSVKSGQTEKLPIRLQNPDGNHCYFTFQIALEDGSILYESNQVPPGKEIRYISINQPLEKGTYTAYITILTNELQTGASMNSAKTKINITAI